jgi:hypothetical protein
MDVRDLARRHVVGSVDTHKDLHVAAVVDERDRVLGSQSSGLGRSCDDGRLHTACKCAASKYIDAGVPAGSAFCSWWVRQRQVGPCPLPGLRSPIKELICLGYRFAISAPVDVIEAFDVILAQLVA